MYKIIYNSQVVEISQNEFNKDGEKVCVVYVQNNSTGQKEKYICKKVITS